MKCNYQRQNFHLARWYLSLRVGSRVSRDTLVQLQLGGVKKKCLQWHFDTMNLCCALLLCSYSPLTTGNFVQPSLRHLLRDICFYRCRAGYTRYPELELRGFSSEISDELFTRTVTRLRAGVYWFKNYKSMKYFFISISPSQYADQGWVLGIWIEFQYEKKYHLSPRRRKAYFMWSVEKLWKPMHD